MDKRMMKSVPDDRDKLQDYDDVMARLKSLSNPKNVAGMARFGINSKNTYGIAVPELREMAKAVGKNHILAQKLWSSGVHEARILASMIDDPSMVTNAQLEKWVKDFDSWDVCDQACGNLFDKTSFAYDKAVEWSKREEEFVKRAGFALIAYIAVHDKKISDERLAEFLPLIKEGSVDNRNFVKKSVNWALRQIGKRNQRLNRVAVKTAKEIQAIDSKSAKWVAADALRELTAKPTQERLRGV